jgi:hypothetical protein
MALQSRNYRPESNEPLLIGSYVGGGTVTQATNRTTGVTLNTISGAITTNTTSLAAATAASFVVTNSQVTTDCVVVPSIQGGTVSGNTDAFITATTNGSFTITVANQSASIAETGAIIINFIVLKASQVS